MRRARQAKLRSIPIEQCRHYNGYRYGAGAFNPYENYIVGLHAGTPRDILRRNFEDFLRYFRPRTFGEVLDAPLPSNIPLWVFPWHPGPFDPQNGWLHDIDNVPDILTHFCDAGIKRSRIDEEYFWLERGYATIRDNGYQPERFAYIEAFEMRDGSDRVFLITEGNHRLSALAAMGLRDVVVRCAEDQLVDGRQSRRWPRVVSGVFSERDAAALLEAYLRGVTRFTPCSEPAAILDA